MALKFDLYLGDWPTRYGGVRKVVKGESLLKLGKVVETRKKE